MLCKAFVASLGDRCLLLTHDRYYHSLPEAVRATPIRHNFDHPDSLDTDHLVRDLQALRAGRQVTVPAYDFASHARCPPERWETVSPRSLIVVEGILVLAHAGLRDAFDHAVYVHTPDDLRLVRRIRRDVRDRGRQAEDVLEQYERTVRPMHEAHVAPSRSYADLELDGTRPVGELVDALHRWWSAQA